MPLYRIYYHEPKSVVVECAEEDIRNELRNHTGSSFVEIDFVDEIEIKEDGTEETINVVYE